MRKDRKHYLVGEVEIRGVCYPTIFMPYYQIHEGKNKLYSHTAFCPKKPPKITQVLANKISILVCRKLSDRDLVKMGIGVNDYLAILENERDDFLALAQSENKVPALGKKDPLEPHRLMRFESCPCYVNNCNNLLT